MSLWRTITPAWILLRVTRGETLEKSLWSDPLFFGFLFCSVICLLMDISPTSSHSLLNRHLAQEILSSPHGWPREILNLEQAAVTLPLLFIQSISKHLGNFYWPHWVLGPLDPVLSGCPRQRMRRKQQGCLRVPDTPKAAGSPRGAHISLHQHAHFNTLPAKVLTRAHLYQPQRAWYRHVHLILLSCFQTGTGCSFQAVGPWV